MLKEEVKKLVHQMREKGKEPYFMVLPLLGDKNFIGYSASILSDIMDEVASSEKPELELVMAPLNWEAYYVVFAHGKQFDSDEFCEAFSNLIEYAASENNLYMKLFPIETENLRASKLPDEQKREYIGQIKYSMDYYMSSYKDGIIVATNSAIYPQHILAAIGNKEKNEVNCIFEESGNLAFKSKIDDSELLFLTSEIKKLRNNSESVDDFLKWCYRYRYWFDTVYYIGEN